MIGKWMDGQMDVWVMYGWIEEWMNVQWMGGLANKWVDGQTEGWTGRCKGG